MAAENIGRCGARPRAAHGEREKMTDAKSDSKVDRCYRYVLDKIMNTGMKAGDRVVISRIAKECGFSDIPVREAVRMLERDGYLVMKANQGAFIATADTAAVADLIRIKGVLGGYAIGQCAGKLSGGEIAALRELNTGLRRIAGAGETEAFRTGNREFHFLLYDRLRSTALSALIRDIWYRLVITGPRPYLPPELMDTACRDHEELLELIVAGDIRALEQRARAHELVMSRIYLRSAPSDR